MSQFSKLLLEGSLDHPFQALVKDFPSANFDYFWHLLSDVQTESSPTLTVWELRKALVELGVESIDDEEFAEIIKQLYADDDGRVGFQAFLNVAEQFDKSNEGSSKINWQECISSQRNKLHNMFRAFDKDHNGFVSVRDMMMIFKSIVAGDYTTQFKEVLDLAKTNGAIWMDYPTFVKELQKPKPDECPEPSESQQDPELPTGVRSSVSTNWNSAAKALREIERVLSVFRKHGEDICGEFSASQLRIIFEELEIGTTEEDMESLLKTIRDEDTSAVCCENLM